MLALAERLQESQQRVLPWWTPASISVFDGRKWQTRKGAAHYPSIFAVNPVDVQGYAHFAAFDIDSRERGDVDKLLAALPEGAIPLVSESGKKGWHIWLFFAEPILPRLAHEFARRTTEKAGISCEVFPSSERTSHRLKWPGCPHPETGVIEEFIDWQQEHILDTLLMLQAIGEDGFYRTPVSVVHEAVPNRRLAPSASPNRGRGTSNGGDGAGISPNIGTLIGSSRRTPSVVPVSGSGELVLADWFRKPEVGLALVHSLGAKVRGVGRTFCCVLPGHRERKPSAALYQCEDGTLIYHDFHRRTQDADGKTLEFLTISEAFAASVSGTVRELPSRSQQAAWGWRLLMTLGFIAPPQIAVAPLPTTIPADVKKVYEGFVLLLQTRILAGLGTPVQFSEQFAAFWCQVSPRVACKSANLLAAIGALKKHADRVNTFSLGTATTEEMEAAYDLLGRPSVASFNKKLVRERMGIGTAEAIFRR